MTTPDLIWNLVSLLIDRIEQDSKKEKEKSNDKDDWCKLLHNRKKVGCRYILLFNFLSTPDFCII